MLLAGKIFATYPTLFEASGQYAVTNRIDSG